MSHLITSPHRSSAEYEFRAPRQYHFLAQDSDFNAFNLPIYERLGAGPAFIAVARGEIDLDRLLAAHGDKLWRAATADERSRSGRWSTQHRLLVFETEPECFVWVNSNVACVRVFARDRELAEKTARDISDQFRSRARRQRSRPQVLLVSIQPSGVEARRVEIESARRLSADDMALLYGRDFPAWDEQLAGILKAPGCGTTILRGPPGTGKTSYLRHLLLKHAKTHRFFYIPTTSFDLLTSPRMVEFWADQNSTPRHGANVVILEDAEALLADRSGGQAGNVSDLLNIADGILGDFLRIKVICTLNCSLERLDPAVTRSGRLLSAWEFKRLGREQARGIAAKHGLILPDQSDYSLAEIFRGQARLPATERRRAMGFGALAASA